MSVAVKETLTKLGLSDSEARVYLGMLKLGPTSVQNIAREAEISRTAAYDIIEALQAKGLASTFDKGKKSIFVAEDPDKLAGYFEKRVKDIQDEFKSLDRLIPELRVMQGGDKPRVRYYSGNEAIYALFRDVEQVQPEELCEFSNVDAVYKGVDEKTLTEARGLVKSESIRVKHLHRGVRRNTSPMVEARKLPEESADFQGDIWIYANRVALIHFVGKVEVVIIDNPMFAETMRALFATAWERGQA